MVGTGRQLPSSASIRATQRGMSMTVAVVILVVVILIVGAAGYFGLQTQKAATTTASSCSGTCPVTTTSDATLFVPFAPGYGQKMTSIEAGVSLTATVGVRGSETIRSFETNWGDGTNSSGVTATFTHAYGKMGLYVISGSATDTKGIVHTGVGQLFPVNVVESFQNAASGYYPALSTTFTNGSVGGIYPWVAQGTTVTVNGSYSSLPTDPLFAAQPPSIVAGSGVTQKTYVSGATWASGSYTLSALGIDDIVFSGVTTNGSARLAFNYTWAVYVAASATGLGCAACSAPTLKSPHPNELVAYEVAPGGAITVDPAASYETNGVEMDLLLFQKLIEQNGTEDGSAPDDFVPELATCVPGTAQCGVLYPGTNDLIQGSNYTFVISPTAKFYDPGTGKSWPVYPSDVLFSFLRTLSFADLPGVSVYPGWIPGQALLPTGNVSWDGAVHSPYNNTPQAMFGAMLVNDSTFCPASAMAAGQSGCITFYADGGGTTWPEFLTLVATYGSYIIPCSWYSSHGATVPGFMGTAGAAQPLATDTGCLLPGNARSSTDPAFQSWLAAQSPTSWDSYQSLAVSNYPSPNPSVQWSAVGSAPYYLESLNPGISYAIRANPAYVAPAGCAGEPGCQPEPGSYAASAVVYWEDDDTVGIQEYTAGYADFATIEPTEMNTQLKLVEDELIGMGSATSLSVENVCYNTEIDLSSLKNYDPYPVNIQSNSLSYLGLRGFLDAAYPYASAQADYNVLDGVEEAFDYGGVIPEEMGNYYPTNISWPDYNLSTGQFGNPLSNSGLVGSAGWYWAQLTNSSGPLYDPQFGLAGYSASNPLHIPLAYFEGASTPPAALDLFGSYVKSLSGGAVLLDVYVVSPSILFAYLLPNGLSPWAAWLTGWGADYAGPDDFWTPYAAATGIYSGADTLYPTLIQPQYNSATCSHSDPTLFSDLTYWADQSFLPQDCQGVAYNLTLHWATVATHDLDLSRSILEWNRVSALFNLLNFYANTQQLIDVFTYAPWINPASISTNPVSGAYLNIFYLITGNGVT